MQSKKSHPWTRWPSFRIERAAFILNKFIWQFCLCVPNNFEIGSMNYSNMLLPAEACCIALKWTLFLNAAKNRSTRCYRLEKES